MPPLTIDGKRQILAMAQAKIGEKNLTTWLNQHNIVSIRYLYENIRRFKAKFFRELYLLSI